MHGWERQFAGRRALLVEDNAVARKVGSLILQKLGFEVVVAEDGDEAIARVNEAAGAYDVVLMDVNMPRRDGLSATRAIRERFASGALPIVAMTASDFDADRDACLDAGMNVFVGKPLELDELVAALAALISKADR